MIKSVQKPKMPLQNQFHLAIACVGWFLLNAAWQLCGCLALQTASSDPIVQFDPASSFESYSVASDSESIPQAHSLASPSKGPLQPHRAGWDFSSSERQATKSSEMQAEATEVNTTEPLNKTLDKPQVGVSPSANLQRIPSPIRDARPLLSATTTTPTVPVMTDDIRRQIGLASHTELESKPASASVQNQEIPYLPTQDVTASLQEKTKDASQTTASSNQDSNNPTDFPEIGAMLTSADNVQSTLKLTLLVGILSLAPAIILMTTCYIRVMVVLTLLKQAFGAQQLPPMQVLSALSLFLTFLIMAPVWYQIKSESLDPYTAQAIDWDEAWQRGAEPIKQFMIRQIEATGNTDSVAVFYQHLPDTSGPPPDDLNDVPLNVLIPAFMISELKIAFLLGFQIFLPFLVLDLVVSSVTVSMGMLMLPPQMVSFPLKLILFVLVDGWNLVIGMLLQSFV